MLKRSDDSKTKIRKALKYRLEETSFFSKSEMKQEVNELKQETSKYTAFRTSVIQNLTSELEGCSEVIIEPASQLSSFFSKLIDDVSFTSIFNVKQENLGKKKVLRISYLVFDK